MARKYIQLSTAQKEEIRRLTQKANRRIATAEKTYSKQGLDIAPRDVVGKYQTKESWETKDRAISRTVKFKSEKEYQERIKMLRSFDGKDRASSKQTLTEYTKISRMKTLAGVEGTLGIDVPANLKARLNKLSAPELSKFWQLFSDNAARKGVQYNSDTVMRETIQEFFQDEDMEGLMK